MGPTMTAALPAGDGRDRVRLWDNQWRALWDSAVDTTPAYRHIATWCHATIDRPDGSRWVGRFTRTREGIIREQYPDPLELVKLTQWPTWDALTGMFE